MTNSAPSDILNWTCDMSFVQSIHANISSDHPLGLRPYGQPGQLPKATEMLPLLIELKAQFYKLVLYAVGGAALCGTMHQLVKRSIKSSKSKYLLYRLCIKRQGRGGLRARRRKRGEPPFTSPGTEEQAVWRLWKDSFAGDVRGRIACFF